MGAARRCQGRRSTPRPRPYGEQIRAELAANNPALLVLDREFETASHRPDVSRAGMRHRLVRRRRQEPRARDRRTVPFEAASRRVPSGRSHAPLQAGAHQRPVRLYWWRFRRTRPHARSRFMSRWRGCSFPAVRSGSPTIAISSSRRIKRHAFKMHTRIGVDRATGKIRAFAADHVLDGGGLANYSSSMAAVGAPARSASTRFRKSMLPRSPHSRGVTAGSMRGYGTLRRR